MEDAAVTKPTHSQQAETLQITKATEVTQLGLRHRPPLQNKPWSLDKRKPRSGLGRCAVKEGGQHQTPSVWPEPPSLWKTCPQRSVYDPAS